MKCASKTFWYVVFTFTLLFATDCINADDERPPAAARQIKHNPLTIAVSTVGDRFAKGYSWHLSVNSSGKAELTIDTFPKKTRRNFQVSAEQLASLRKILLKERFFELKDQYGNIVPDSSTDTLTVIAGDKVKTVKLNFLMNWVKNDKPKVREPARAVRVLLLIREWFDDAEAVDLRRYDRLVVKAAESSGSE